VEAPDLQVPGFRAAGVHCGIKDAAMDLALIASDGPAAAAGLFTRSSVVGAPVELSRAHLRDGRARAIVANSGISNVAMGARGRRDAAEMARCAARALGARPTEVLVASTGSRPAAEAADARGHLHAAEAIRTTDTFAKRAVATARVGGRRITVAGIAKGSGMIEPDLATMLAFLVTDAQASPRFLRRVLRTAADESFNRLTVDGETSTSDTVLLLAGGAAGNPELRGPASAGAARFAAAVTEVSLALARELARDGEGATKLVTVRVEGARSPAEAERAARRVANSLLVKTALHGGDANWGRVLQTVGAARVALRLDRTEVKLCGIVVFRRGAATGPAARRRAAAKLRAAEVDLEVRLGVGRSRARLWTCDLSAEYVRINAEYTT
jgi:glutamate N-acetyltransferase/amino-acid N-acetyltransferase